MQILDLPANVAAPGTVAAVPLALIDPDADNERSEADLTPEVLGDLMTTLRDKGQVEPILIYPLPGGRYGNQTGHRRCAAARALGWTTIQAVIVPAPADAVERALGRIVSNMQREDPDPIKLAGTFKILLDAGTDQKTLARKLGHTQPWISNQLRLLALPAEIQALISAGKLTAAHGIELLRVDEDEIDYKAQPTGKTAAAIQTQQALEAVKQGYSAKQLREEVNGFRNNQAQRRKWAAQSRRHEAEYEARRAADAAAVAAGQETTTQRQERERQEQAAREVRTRDLQTQVSRRVIAETIAADPDPVKFLRVLARAMAQNVFASWWAGERGAILGKKEDVYRAIGEAGTVEALTAWVARLLPIWLGGPLDYWGQLSTDPLYQWAASQWDLKTKIATAQRAALQAAGLLDPPASSPTGDGATS